MANWSLCIRLCPSPRSLYKRTAGFFSLGKMLIRFEKEILISVYRYMRLSVVRNHLSRVMRKPTFWFPPWPDTNKAVQPHKIARGLKFRI